MSVSALRAKFEGQSAAAAPAAPAATKPAARQAILVEASREDAIKTFQTFANTIIALIDKGANISDEDSETCMAALQLALKLKADPKMNIDQGLLKRVQLSTKCLNNKYTK